MKVPGKYDLVRIDYGATDTEEIENALKPKDSGEPKKTPVRFE